VRVLAFARDAPALQDQLVRRVGQCVMTAATASCFDDLPSPETVRLGSMLRFFGDGLQTSKAIDPSLALAGGGAVRPRRVWRIPVMDGEFVCEDSVGMIKGVGGGNFLVLATSHAAALASCEAAVEAMRKVPNVIMPFPGGIVRSGSKVGAKYKGMMASTNDAYCPTLRGATKSALDASIGAVLEIVIDGLTAADISAAMRAGITAACAAGAAGGVHTITAGNYGGKLGKHHFRLHDLLATG